MPDLTVDHVSKQYPTRGEPLSVLRDVSLQLSAGENLAVLGPSGSGKSTLLYAIGTLDPPTHGTITLCGQDPYKLARTRTGPLPQSHDRLRFSRPSPAAPTDRAGKRLDSRSWRMAPHRPSKCSVLTRCSNGSV